jgi:hypothetical protein
MLFLHWHASKSRGKLDVRPSIPTLEWKIGRFACMYEHFYQYKIPQETIDEVRDVGSLYTILFTSSLLTVENSIFVPT